jgi:hypothetical protein
MARPKVSNKFLRGVAVKHCSARIKNGVSVYGWTAKDSLFEDHLGPGPASSPVDFLAIHSKSQTDLVGKETVTYADPISVAQDWLNGGDSPAANVDRSKLRGSV